jgi:hypothetical protein
MADRLEARLGLNTDDFDKGVNKAKGSVNSFSGELAGLGSALTIGMFALNGLKNAFIETEAGAQLLLQTGAVVKQFFRDLAFLSKPGVLGFDLSNLKEAAKIARESNEIKIGARRDQLDQKDIETQIKTLTFESISEKNITKKIEKLKEVKRLQEGLSTLMAISAKKEETSIISQLAQPGNITNPKLWDELTAKQLEIKDIEGRVIEYRKIEQQITQLTLQQQKELTEQVRLQGQYLETGYKLEPIKGRTAPRGDYGIGQTFSHPGLNKLNPAVADPIKMAKVLNQELASQQELLGALADKFAGFFSGVNLGFQGMVDGVITGIKRVVTELMAKAAILAILGMIFPASGIFDNFGKMLFGDTGGLFKGKSGGGNSGVGNIIPTGGLKLTVDGVISGKDLALVARRNNF